MQHDNSTHNTLCSTMTAAPTPMQHDNSTHNTLCGATTAAPTPMWCNNSAPDTTCSTMTVPPTPCTAQHQQLQHQTQQNDSSHDIACSETMAATTPTWCGNSAHNTTHGMVVAIATPNMALHASDLLGLHVLID